MKFFTMFKLYSVQVITFVAGLNIYLAGWADAPQWVVVAVNVAGALAGVIARATPQPAVAAQLSS